MHRGLVSCPGDTPLNEVAEAMVEQSIHCVLVEPSDEEFRTGRWRIVSDLDLVAAAEAPWSTAKGVSATPTITVSEADDVMRAATLMSEFQSAHLIVVDALGAPIGVVSTLDLAAAMSAPQAPALADGDAV
jgi:CBS domain-containing protein